MAELRIRCPNTGAVVGTGVDMTSDELDAMSTTDVTAGDHDPVLVCGDTHQWSKADVVRSVRLGPRDSSDNGLTNQQGAGVMRWAPRRRPPGSSIGSPPVISSAVLVVAELKRDRAPDTVEMQAVKYAAMVSRFTVDTLAEVYAHFASTREWTDFFEGGALSSLMAWAPELSDETLRSPRIVLVASGYSSTTTSTVVFLSENGVDISLVKVQAYRTSDNDYLITASQIWPVPDAEEFTVAPRTAARNRIASTRARRASIQERILEAGALAPDAELRIQVPDRVQQDRESISTWLDEQPDRARARWTGEKVRSVRWEVDQQPYSLTGLIRSMIRSATGEEPIAEVWGPVWFRTVDGKTLWDLVKELPAETAE